MQTVLRVSWSQTYIFILFINLTCSITYVEKSLLKPFSKVYSEKSFPSWTHLHSQQTDQEAKCYQHTPDLLVTPRSKGTPVLPLVVEDSFWLFTKSLGN